MRQFHRDISPGKIRAALCVHPGGFDEVFDVSIAADGGASYEKLHKQNASGH